MPGAFHPAQGLQHLVDLVDDMYSDGGALSDAGVCCIWRVLEAAAAAALNQRCRLLAAAGLPSRLVALCARARADLATMQEVPRPRVRAPLCFAGFLWPHCPTRPHVFAPVWVLSMRGVASRCHFWRRKQCSKPLSISMNASS